MFFFFFDNKNVQVELGNSPKQADIAIAPISDNGSIGLLNEYILKEYGYSKVILNNLNLKKGFDFFQLNGKPILFVVTVDKGNTENNLKNNLRQAITINFTNLSNKKIWIPLMGTGGGGLTYSESYDIITSLLDELKDYIFKFNCEFIISIPIDDEGKKLYTWKSRDRTIDDILENDNVNSFDNIKEINNSIEEETISESKAKNIITDSNARFYLVGTIWGDEEQSERFYKEGIWENGHENREYFDLINRVKENDILIHKSSFSTRNGKSILRIKAFGIVKYIHNNGKKLDVDWIIKLNEKLDVDGLGFYRDTISSVNIKDLIKIFTAFSSQDFEELYYTFVHKKKTISNIDLPSSTKLAGLIADVEIGEDYLDIKKDVNAFARVIAAKSFQPPLAIALLGKWGSGKSFFMRKLKENIQVLSKENPQKAFCEGVANVHFNAWSYMDANLWASIVTRIFESLEEYINGLNLPQKEKKEIENELFQKLTISKEEHLELENQQNQVKKRLHELKTNKKNIKRELKAKINSIRTKSLKDILNEINQGFKVEEKIIQTLNENSSFVDSAQKFEKIVPKEYWNNPTAFYNEIKGINSFFKTFFRRKSWKTNLCWFLIILLLLIITPIVTFILNLLISWEDFSFTNKQWVLITFYGTLFTRSIDTYLKLKKQIAPFWNLKEEYEKEKEEAIFKFKQEEKSIKLEISQQKDEVIQVNKEINTNLQLQANLKFKLENALSTHALYTFIEKRANSDDYKKHLGIVSLIRKDFEILSGLLTDHKTELVSKEDSIEFKELFKGKKPLERIILYIDDLDRCPEERVVEVLEAVNLLMAFPLFVVIVGVDPRWVKTALQKKYDNQFKNVHENEEAISPSNYLEKIFQVSFNLKEAEDSNVKNMIRTLANIKVEIIDNESNESDYSEEYNKNDYHLESLDIIEKDKKINQLENEPIKAPEKLIDKEKIEALDISENEINNIQKITFLIGNNPRKIKRYINLYRIIKTHQDFENNDKNLINLIFNLAISLGNYKDIFNILLKNINENSFASFEKLDSLINNIIKDLKKNLQTNSESELIVLNKLAYIYQELKNDWPELLELDLSLIEEQNEFIKRFTFKNI
ncbi:hypothetical protein G6N05_02170 [Flavobacterium sp. F372]|uniref:KAP NTPase domain-containing protein n=1 Tax=Flavobacterium bernardetii TaxID=2813823 RepID=A0ABR7IVP2_9FLAO|nr:P-loop NTPase fold protein [Flavobacterium bernardetii]MBC5833682.1 hypothetical protein [Flavobacterium bernardetii]NHF68915.1 hypothetical protein [Flavobacterium bernardetii]